MADSGEQGADGQTLQTSFFIMPGNALKSLRDELSISTGEKLAEGIIYRYGIRCGEGMIQRMSIKCDDMIGLSEMLPGIWAGVGLGRIQLKDITDEGMLVIFKESIESKTVGQSPVPACHFTRGYLSGMASAALNGKKITRRVPARLLKPSARAELVHISVYLIIHPIITKRRKSTHETK